MTEIKSIEEEIVKQKSLSSVGSESLSLVVCILGGKGCGDIWELQIASTLTNLPGADFVEVELCSTTTRARR